MLKLIVCVDQENGIGKNNQLPWSNKEEMKHFKETTTGHTIVMGRKTFESIGRILPNRKNIIFSNNKELKIEGAIVCNDIQEILELSKQENIFIIGGSQIYNLFFNYCDELIISRLKENYNCDTFIDLDFKNFTKENIIEKESFAIEYYKNIKLKILDGKKVANDIKNELSSKLEELVSKYKRKPQLVIVQVGEDFASSVYIRNKIKLANDIGIEVIHNHIKKCNEQELITQIEKMNNNKNVDGILVQLPLPKEINEGKICSTISPTKDVDCFNPINVGQVWINPQEAITTPCTPTGVIELLKRSDIKLESKNVVIVGRSNIVGKPLASLFLAENSTIQICHSKTMDLKNICKKADIVVAAIGKANFIDSNFLKENSIVVDVGINRNEENKLCGDVNFEDVKNIVSYITPVPGGIGPMTLVMLMKNLITCYELNNKGF
ncbi:MAG: dihydrofolate reductase [Mycoplasma sp.]